MSSDCAVPSCTGSNTTFKEAPVEIQRERKSFITTTRIQKLIHLIYLMCMLHFLNLAASTHSMQHSSLLTSAVEKSVGVGDSIKKDNQDTENFQDAAATSGKIPHLQDMMKMKDDELFLSIKHQIKFFSVRDQVLYWVKGHKEHSHLLKGTGKRGRLFAININEGYSFRHIFKSGGTTVLKQTHSGLYGHVPQWEVGNRTLFTTVRDPLDHFLSG